jgi:hypothetical protein
MNSETQKYVTLWSLDHLPIYGEETSTDRPMVMVKLFQLRIAGRAKEISLRSRLQSICRVRDEDRLQGAHDSGG